MSKVAIVGAGAIGCWIGGHLDDAVFVARERTRRELEEHGLTLVEGDTETKRTVTPRFADDASEADVVLVCVKSAQTADVGADLARTLPESRVVISMQNGVRNADVLREHLPKHTVLGGIVGFNVVPKREGVFRRTTTGLLVCEWTDDERVTSLVKPLDLQLAKDIRGQQWSKLLMNLNNAISALSDAPTPVLLFDPGYRRIVRAVIVEALGVMKDKGIRPARLGPMPPALFPLLLRLPTPLVRALSRLQVKVDPEARSSMWEDLHRRRPTEVDYLNGEIVRLGNAPINERIVTLIHEAERAGKGSPKMSADALWTALTSS